MPFASASRAHIGLVSNRAFVKPAASRTLIRTDVVAKGTFVVSTETNPLFSNLNTKRFCEMALPQAVAQQKKKIIKMLGESHLMFHTTTD